MRIISIGCPIPSPSVDNHSIANASSIFDYDACIVDLQSVSEQIEGIAATTLDVKAPDGRAIGIGESGAFHFGLGELLQQRQLEFQQLLDNGRCARRLRISNVRHPNIASFPGLNRYSLIPGLKEIRFAGPRFVPPTARISVRRSRNTRSAAFSTTWPDGFVIGHCSTSRHLMARRSLGVR